MMGKLHFPLRVLTSTILTAFAAILLLVPAAGISQSDAKKDAGPPFNDNIDDPAEWGKAFPKHYESYKKSVDMQRTKHGGSEAVPHTPTQADPRSVVARSKSEEDKGLKAIWQGYAFSEDFREERGHAYMLEDQRLTKRQVVVKQPGACVNCHASMYLAYKKAGNGDITKGFEKINAMPYAEATKLVTHPVACIDCHDGTTLALRVTRPAFIEGMRAYKASLGVKDYDVNKQASSAEMRAYVCGQFGIDLDRPLMCQVSRFDPWKDPLGVIDAYRIVKAEHPEVQLALVGSMAHDDPEGWDYYNRTVAHAAGDPDIFILSNLNNIGSVEVNAFQVHSAAVIQKSIREGFGLTVTEALWKARPTIGGRAGGIRAQIKDGETGWLVDSSEECADACREILDDPVGVAVRGRRGKEDVRERFLMPRLLRDWLALFNQLAGNDLGETALETVAAA
jgi:glycosyltransferase involved in cell wall biosynthesis